ncbi:hypothetical protein Mpop_0709 [Methylorubrum populi BJ001]|uniref:Uncharacterized protein n=1 Tax=Methylorubrum populi (strain ATCC BAA-705 / NCIMB 13946 / BJ001) TaxID=441620 RepID=B1Z704_METPB|nr:hypothetical protein [Methylorubrum populi]ACB78887.1 hypothetical protein Mpop_0709 [Methylorubrum populi BJ001]OAH37742.1 hypothetical protein AX289_18310 [Methylorubrum populi]
MLPFSHRYLRPEVVQDDSKRMRVQIEAAFENFVHHGDRHKIATQLEALSGGKIPLGQAGYMWHFFFEHGELRDILDVISITYKFLKNIRPIEKSLQWSEYIQFAFDTHNMRYRMSDDGSVVLRVDEEFEEARAATLSGLQQQRYTAARIEFETAYKALSVENPDGKRAVRSMFEAAEIVFKMMFADAQRLAGPQLGQHLKPFIIGNYAADPPARQAAERLLQGFTEWVASAQYYRHGQGQEEPNQPPLEIAVTLMGAGASYLRWLIHLDQAKLAAGA